MRRGPSDVIVVGIDGRPAGRAAASWAASLARRIGSELLLVHAREEGRPVPFPSIPREEREERERTPLDEALGDISSLTVHREVAAGGAAKALLDAADGADLLVLGRPHRRVPDKPSSGGTTRRILDRSPCPVVLVPERGERSMTED
jgi:nucleotide-binding universal stress UspA family protein